MCVSRNKGSSGIREIQGSEVSRSADTQFWQGGWRGRSGATGMPAARSCQWQAFCVSTLEGSCWTVVISSLLPSYSLHLASVKPVKAQEGSNCLGFSLQKWSIWDLPGQRSALKSPHLVRLTVHWTFNMKNYLADIKLSLPFPEIKAKHKFLKELKQLIFHLLLLF